MRTRFVVSLSMLLFGASPADAFVIYTLAEDVVFEVTMPANDAVVKGTFRAVPPEVFAAWNLSTGGENANAPAGTHTCTSTFLSCPFKRDFDIEDQADGLAFGLSLDSDSGPVSGTGPVFSQFVDDAFGGTAYIISADPADRVPDSSSGDFFFFQDPVAQSDPQFFVQPGESTAWLISRYVPGEIEAALTGGATLRMSLADARVPINFAQTAEVALIELPGANGADRDADGIPDDSDLCPDWPSSNEDTDANGIGDECECGDQNGDGIVNILDILDINRVIFGLEVASPLCDTNEDEECNILDILGANAKLFGTEAFCARYPSVPL